MYDTKNVYASIIQLNKSFIMMKAHDVYRRTRPLPAIENYFDRYLVLMGKEADRPPKVIVCIYQFCFNSVSGKFLVDGISLVLLLLNGMPSYVYDDVQCISESELCWFNLLPKQLVINSVYMIVLIK